MGFNSGFKGLTLYTTHKNIHVALVRYILNWFSSVEWFISQLIPLCWLSSVVSYIFQYISNKMQRYTFYLHLETALHVSGGISTHNQERKQLYLQHLVFVIPLQVAVTVWQIPDVVDTVVCSSDVGWRYHPKHVEHFPDKIKCVTLHLVGYIL